MNYSRKISRRAIARRFVLSCTATGVLCMLIGILIGYLLWGFMPASAAVKEKSGTDIQYDFYIPNLDESEVTVIITEADVQEEAENYYINCRMPFDQQEYLYKLCKQYDLDYYLVMALISTESSFNEKVVSSTHDYGLMQINSCNQSELNEALGISDLLDPYQNMQAGCYLLNELFTKYSDVDRVLMSYNMGETAATKLWNKGTHSTSYSRKVKALRDQYAAELGW